eukprot:CAMPEP_0201709484 /NCGR_PEP_ID=MMETSP0578-20130828/58126_1 /ASSEMBLY_ACC=CAM_ASM_000663 /TAXON_ID=267565 /ORGANISM="Skeletonema grethea, Strain CCMP 1804" /LENGTH=209 /DNA_ID=CAMNT_0048198461 /DNA_START=118 /DNA_END=748 /DNA_ORIENTATION=-
MSSTSNTAQPYPAPAVMGPESIMSKKAHGTSATPVQQNLRWNVDRDVADRICNFNRHYAEYSGYFKAVPEFMNETNDTPADKEITFYDSNTGKPPFWNVESDFFKAVPEFMNETHDTPADKEITFYDSNTGKPLFYAPRGRTMDQFIRESRNHGWPSFRDEEVEWENVRVLTNGETVSVDGTHLGHNLPDGKGSRYCINLVCVAGNPTK